MDIDMFGYMGKGGITRVDKEMVTREAMDISTTSNSMTSVPGSPCFEKWTSGQEAAVNPAEITTVSTWVAPTQGAS